MMRYAFEGGPLDGQLLETSGAHVYRVPRPIPWNTPGADLAYSVWEYQRSGSVYRFETLIDDAHARMRVAAEAFREADVRRMCRAQLRASLERLGSGKEVDRIVWVLGLDRLRAEYTVVAVVGGRRAMYAVEFRRDVREATFS